MRTLFHYILSFILLGSIAATAQAPVAHSSLPANGVPTPVSGESWINHLSRPFSETSMGKTGELGPTTDDDQSERTTLPGVAAPAPDTTLSGADLYRFNCRGCHGAEGLGAPPEINSVINPVRATSVSLVMQRMKSRGLDISLSSANELSKEARAALLQRIHEGGENMPSFSYLSTAEIDSIVAYLNELADVPGSAKANRVRESPERVGELIVKSTCHICHGATGPNPNEQQLYEGQIPPLEVLSSRVDQARFINKVTHGSPILMGDPPSLYRGRMPVFYYLSSQEAADAYFYLNYYPPNDKTRSAAVVSSVQAPPEPPAGGAGPSKANTEAQGSAAEAHSNGGLTTNAVLLIAGLFAFVLALSVGGLAFTIREFSRLSRTRALSPALDDISGEQRKDEARLLSRCA